MSRTLAAKWGSLSSENSEKEKKESEAASKKKGLPKFQLLIFVNGRAIYGLPFILNMAENLSPEEDLESLCVQWTLLMSGWVFH